MASRIRIAGVSGNATVTGGSITATDGVNIKVPVGTHVSIDAVTQNAKVTDTNIKASLKTNITVIKGTDSEAISGKSNFCFGQQPHAALLLSGTGKGADIFKEDVQSFKTFLVDTVGISKDLIGVVEPKPKAKRTTIEMITLAVDDIVQDLEDTKDATFIFYYSGHFNGDHNFQIDGKGTPEKDFYLDDTLATNLLRIPARHMLFVLDMCYSGSAEVHAKSGAMEVYSTTGLTDKAKYHLVCPNMWDVSCKKGDGTDISPDKIVQWSSSKPSQASYGTAMIGSRFTNAIINTMIMERASVLDVHRMVCEYMENEETNDNKQEPMIQPNYADELYFKDFPNLTTS